MAEIASLARPYVRAVFDLAKADDDLAAWSDQLQAISVVVEDPQIAGLDGHPRVSAEQVADLVIGVLGDALNAKAQNLVRLLASNRRLGAAAEIKSQYDVLRAEAENQIEAELETAVDVDSAQQQKIADALKAKMGREVKLSCSTNPDLLGGAVIRTGDWVYDGSVRAQLQKMAASLSA